jgi:hypothetical protein
MKTAVEWLEIEFVKLEHSIGVHNEMYKLIEQAKEMEKQQERMYSEEEVLAFGQFCVDKIADFLNGKGDQTDGKEYSMKELFEQFKKK